MNEIATIAVPAIQITPPRFIPGDRIDRLGVLYEYVEKAEGKKKFVRLDTGADAWIDNMELLTQMSNREIRMAIPSWLPSQREKIWRRDFYSLPEHEKRRALLRQAYVDAFLENRTLGYPDKVHVVLHKVYRKRMMDPASVIAGELKPSLAAVYEWLSIWEKPGLKGIKRLCFAESERGIRGTQISEEITPIFWQAVQALWYTPQRHRVRTIYNRVIADAAKQGLSEQLYPCLRTLRRLLTSLPPYAVMRARQGTRVADQEFRSKGQLPPTLLAGQVYELDAHKLDAIGIDDRMGLPLGRLWLTAVIDRCTRLIVGFHIHVEPPSALTVAAALRNAFAPKLYMLNKWPEIGRPWVPWGLPELVILDNGLENHATFLTEGLHELGVNWVFAPPRTPEFKPHIERWFGTLTRDFSSRLPGWTGSNPQHKGDYDAMSMASLTLSQIDELLHRWVICYNLDWHEGIRDIPERLWLERTADLEVTPIEDMGLLDVLLGDYAERTPTPSGIHLLGIRFGDLGDNRPLELIRTRASAAGLTKVRIRFDRNDLSHIFVQDPQTKEYLWLSSLDPDYTTGLTLAQHRIIRRHAVERCKGYVSIAELCTSRDDLQRRIDEMTGQDPMSDRRFAAVFNGLGSKGSWADFYRLAEAEYGIESQESLARSVVALLEAVEAEPGSAKASSVSPHPTPETTQAPSKPDEGIVARSERLGVIFEGIELPANDPVVDEGPSGPLPAQAESGEQLRARMAALGMEVEDIG